MLVVDCNNLWLYAPLINEPSRVRFFPTNRDNN